MLAFNPLTFLLVRARLAPGILQTMPFTELPEIPVILFSGIARELKRRWIVDCFYPR